MCMEVLKQARIKTIYYGASQLKQVNYKPIPKIKIENVEKAQQLLTDFFKNKRK